MRNSLLGDQAEVDSLGATENLVLVWQYIRSPIVLPLLQVAVYLCAIMSVMLFVERVYMAAVILCVKILRKKRYTKYKLQAVKDELEVKNNHPTVLVQIPMYNEKERVSVWKKLHVIYAFFFVRKIVAHLVTFFFYCVVIPVCVLVPDVRLPKFVAVYIPSAITILNAISTPRSIHLLIFWVLFENVMSLHRSKAAIIGLLEAQRSNEWIVTEKLGNALKQRPTPPGAAPPKKKPPRSRVGDRIHVLELLMGLFLFYCAIYNIVFRRDHFYVYLLFQSVAFFVMGFGYVGTFVPN